MNFKNCFNFLHRSLKSLVVAIILVGTVANAAQLECTFKFSSYPEPDYQCYGKIVTTKEDSAVDSLLGTHLKGKSNDDVRTVIIKEQSMEFLPSGLRQWFKNYRGLALYKLTNYILQRSDFIDYRRIDSLYIGNLSQVSTIPSDAFYELTNLTHLYLERMTNMGNLGAEMLLNMPRLSYFSARGPNRITTISSTFFARQSESLEVVDFRDVNLLIIAPDTFANTRYLHVARFRNAGCLNYIYVQSDLPGKLNDDIRKNCRIGSRNQIVKKLLSSSSSSDSSSSDSSSEENCASLSCQLSQN